MNCSWRRRRRHNKWHSGCVRVVCLTNNVTTMPAQALLSAADCGGLAAAFIEEGFETAADLLACTNMTEADLREIGAWTSSMHDVDFTTTVNK